MNKKLDEISKQDLKGKGGGSIIQFQLEEELTNVKDDLTTSIDKNYILEKEITKLMTKFEKVLKWTVFS